MKHFGIICKPLVQSFSANHFNKKFADEHIDAEYSLYPLEQIEDFPALIQSRAFAGMNVTIPYKSAVIPYLSELDETAHEIGAVSSSTPSGLCFVRTTRRHSSSAPEALPKPAITD